MLRKQLLEKYYMQHVNRYQVLISMFSQVLIRTIKIWVTSLLRNFKFLIEFESATFSIYYISLPTNNKEFVLTLINLQQRKNNFIKL